MHMLIFSTVDTVQRRSRTECCGSIIRSALRIAAGSRDRLDRIPRELWVSNVLAYSPAGNGDRRSYKAQEQG